MVQMSKQDDRMDLKVIDGKKPPDKSNAREGLPAVNGSEHGQRDIPTNPET
jgi:hypothetical protein